MILVQGQAQATAIFIKPDEWIRGNYQPIACLRHTSAELELALDIRFFEDVESGLGPIRIAGFKTPGGRHFAIIEYLKSPIGRGVQIEALHDEHFATDLDEILEALDMDLTDVAEFNSKTSISPEVRLNSHVLWRRDDNGARTVIGTFPCRASATKQMRAFEAAGHKQTYWVDPQTP